jgi:nitrogen fixation protein FixH
MAIESQNSDYDLKTSAATVYNKTADAATAGSWELDVRVGDGTKNLHTNAATLTLAVTIAGETINGSSASMMKDAGVLRARLSTPRIHVVAGEAITVTLLSNNANDADVDVTITPRRVADVTVTGQVYADKLDSMIQLL